MTFLCDPLYVNLILCSPTAMVGSESIFSTAFMFLNIISVRPAWMSWTPCSSASVNECVNERSPYQKHNKDTALQAPLATRKCTQGLCPNHTTSYTIPHSWRHKTGCTAAAGARQHSRKQHSRSTKK